MNLLFVLADLPGKGKANCNIAYSIKNEIEKMGENVFVYGKYEWIKKTQKVVQLTLKSKLYCKYVENKNLLYKVIFRVLYPLIYGKKENLTYNLVYNEITNNITKIVKKFNIDGIVIFSAPHELNEILNINVNVPTFLYILDPYFSHYLNVENQKLLEIKEYDLNKKADFIFMTSLILNDYNKSEILKKLIYKCERIDFPSINSEIYKKNNNVEETVVSFFGNLYKDIRNPENAIDLFSKTKIKNLKLNFYGQKFGFEEEYFQKLKVKYPFVNFYNPISSDEVKKEINKSDFLLNIGNSITNQMPSKIIEYINTGKPIINIHKIKECPTLEFTKKYELVLNIDENVPDIHILSEFLKENKNKMISKEDIINNYYYCSVEFISSKVLNKLIDIKMR